MEDPSQIESPKGRLGSDQALQSEAELMVRRWELSPPTLTEGQSEDRPGFVTDTVGVGDKTGGRAAKSAGGANVLWVGGMDVEKMDRALKQGVCERRGTR